MITPGKYDDICVEVVKRCESKGAVVIIFDGKLGSGFSVVLSAAGLLRLPDVLRSTAQQIENQMKGKTLEELLHGSTRLGEYLESEASAETDAAGNKSSEDIPPV